jgi:molybdate transport system substrate-binding protein
MSTSSPQGRWMLGLVASLALLWSTTGCHQSEEETAQLTVFAASSMTEALEQVAAAWVAEGNMPVRFSFDASSRLARQIEAGAPADVYVSADQEWMDYLDAAGRIVPGSREVLVGNTLVAVVPKHEARQALRAQDLLVGQGGRLALAGESVPAGRYAREALKHEGAWAALEGRVVNADNVRVALGWVASGEADAGVVYATDARSEARVRVAFTFPSSAHPPIEYAAAVVTQTADLDDATRFMAYLNDDSALLLFRAAGFSSGRAP